MKIAIIDPVGMKAGMNCYDIGLLDALDKLKYETYLFSNFKTDNYPGIKQYAFFLTEKKNVITNALNFSSGHIKALKVCRTNKITWIILHVFSATLKDYYSFWITKKKGFKIIAIVHDVSSLSNQDNRKYRDKIYSLSDSIVVHNDLSKTLIEKNLTPINKVKLKVIPHGNYIDYIKGIRPMDEFSDVTFDKKYRYLLFFGQIKKVKGLDILLHAMEHLPPDVKLIIAGRPHRDNFDKYEKIIIEKKLEGRITRIIRFITDEQRDFLFKKADALILPYRKIFQSGVLLLAMSYGLPVVASDLPANKEIIKDGVNGMLFEDGDPNNLSKKINELFSQNYDTIKTASYKTVEEDFSWDKIAKKYTTIFELC